MKKLLVILFFALTIGACKKDQPSPVDEPLGFCAISAMSYSPDKLKYNFEYDKDQRVKKVITYDTANGKVRFYEIYEYGTQLITRVRYTATGYTVHTMSYHLDDNGLPVLRTFITPRWKDSCWFTYNPDGYLTRSIRKESLGGYDTLYYFYSDGKLTEVLEPNIFPAKDTIVYEYYDFEVQPNTYALVFSEFESSADPAEYDLLLGKNTNLAVKSRTVRNNGNPAHISHRQYFYEFDADSNLVKIRGNEGYLNVIIFKQFELNVKTDCK